MVKMCPIARLEKRWMVWLSLLAGLSSAAAGQIQRDRIYEALISGLAGNSQSVRGVLLPQDLDLSAAVPLRDDVTLDLAAVTWNALLGRWEFRLRCRVANECVPFLVTSRMSKSAALKLRGTTEISREARWPSEDVAAGLSKSENKIPVIEAGQNAKVVLERPALQITLQVVCLERGAPGQWIRVRMREGRARVFRAQVVSAGLLSVEQGALP